VVDGCRGAVRAVAVRAGLGVARGPAQALLQADRHGIAGYLADDFADVGLDRELMLTASYDGGASWTSPIQANDNASPPMSSSPISAPHPTARSA
jgi:hypothetical protein